MAVVFLTATSITSWTVPVDWSNVNTIECIGAGGGGDRSDNATFNGTGGGGGEYRRITNVTGLSGSIPVAIGVGGAGGATSGASGANGGATTFNVGGTAGTVVVANGGHGAVGATPGAGGTGGTGTTGFAGGAGGAQTNTGNVASGGGGAGGPNGIGGAGGAATSGFAGAGGGGGGGGTAGTAGTSGSANGTAGGNSSAGTGSGAGGAAGTPTGSAGASGTVGGGGGGGGSSGTSGTGGAGGNGGSGIEWDPHAPYGSGGGGGAGGGSSGGAVQGGAGGNGGTYGGGGGGGGNAGTSGVGGSGANGIIVITYTPVVLTATNYYVSSTATGSGSGTIASPWNITQLNAHTFAAADHIYFDAGHAAISGSIALSTSNWSTTATPTASNPVVFDSYAGPSATINSGTANGLTATAVGGIVIQNLTFVGASASANGNFGILFTYTGAPNIFIDFIQVRNCTVSFYGVHGIEVIGNTASGGYSNILIYGCTIHDGGGFNPDNNTPTSAIVVGGSYITSALTTQHYNMMISNCTCYNWNGCAATGTPSGFAILVYNVNYLTIQYCLCHDCGSGTGSSGGPAGIQNTFCNNSVIQFCEVYNISDGTSNVDGDGYNPSGTVGNLIQYCYSHDNRGAGYLLDSLANFACDCTMRYCITQNDGVNTAINIPGGIVVVSEASGPLAVNIYNNTVYTSHTNSSCFLTQTPAAALSGRVNDNIFYVTGTLRLVVVAGLPALIFDGNNYFRGGGGFSVSWNAVIYSSLALWKAGTGVPAGTEVHSAAFSTANPLLTNPGGGGATNGYNPYLLTAYLLQSTSTMKNNGLNLQSLFGINQGTQDFAGMGVPNPNFNVGAMDTDILACGQALL